MGHRLDVRPSAADHPLRRRSILLKGTSHPLPAATPDTAWLSGWFPGIRDQGEEGSCTGHGGSGFREVLHGMATKHLVPERLSPAYLYGKTRQAEHSFPGDAGATVADTMTTLHSWGVCRESVLPYSGNPSEAPTPASDRDAATYRVGQPMEVALTVQAFKTVLAAGLPIVFGMAVGQSFLDTPDNGNVVLPPPGESPLGGHCMFAVGYNAYRFQVANSWGPGWGQFGWAYFPWEYLSTGAFFEAWTCNLVA